MVEVTLDFGTLEQGTISETGTNYSASDQVRTGYFTNDYSFFKCVTDFQAAVLKPVEGSMEGIPKSSPSTYDAVPGVPSDYTINSNDYNNPNYKTLYYWWHSGTGNNYKRGCVALRLPKYNYAGTKPKARGFRDISSSAYASFNIDYDSIDVLGNSITYTSEGETITKSITQLLSASSDDYFAELRGERDSEDKLCEMALLGFTSNNTVIYSKRWELALEDNFIDFSEGLPIAKWRFVLKVDGVSTLKASHILNDHKKFKLQMDSWEMTQDDILINSGMCEEIDSELLVYPFPASFWELDSSNKLEMFMLPEPYAENHSIVHDNPDGTEYFNQHSNAYDSALSNLNNNYRIRLEILTDEETVIGEITKDLSLTAVGQITINYEQITRRSCSLSLINVDNKYIPIKNSPFWLNRKFKLWLGLVVGKDTYWWSQGIFYTVSANATGRILSIEGVDKGGALDGTLKLNMTEAQYQFKRGKALTEMIKQTLALDVGNPYGANNSPIGFGGNRPIDSQPPLIGIEYYGFNTVADISIDANSYISEIFVNMAELYAADCYYNTNGNLVFEQHIDSSGYNYVPTQWSFTDLSSTFEDVNYEYSYEGENVVTVYTNTTEAGVRNVAWTAYNTNPLSPLNVATGIRRAPHIEIPYYHNEQLSQDQQEAQQIKDCRSTANHYLLANSMLGMTLNFNAPIIPHMDVNKTIQISDRYADIEDGIYVVQSITIPLSSDKMQINATNINWLPNDMTFGGVSEIVQSNSNQNGGAET